MQKALEQPQHIAALDGLRGLAIISVVAVHANLSFGGPYASGRIRGPLAAVLGGGWTGVDLFFVLSGFLITGILCDAKGSQRFLRNFWMRRALRIMPLYFGYLAFVTVIAAVKPGICGVFPLAATELTSLVGYYYNFWVALVTERPIPHAHHFWSLCVEEHFYLIWPMVVMRFSPNALLKICAAGIVASLACRAAVIGGGLWLPVAYFITPCRVDGLLAGSFVAVALRHETARVFVRRWAGHIMLGSGCLLLGLLLGQRHFLDFIDLRRIQGPAVDSSMTLTVGITALSLFFASALVRILDSPADSRLQRFLRARWLLDIGKYSYAMYIFHSLVLVLVLGVLERHAPSVLRLPDPVGKPLLALLVLLFAYVAARISFHGFEKHFLQLKKYFPYRTAKEGETA